LLRQQRCSFQPCRGPRPAGTTHGEELMHRPPLGGGDGAAERFMELGGDRDVRRVSHYVIGTPSPVVKQDAACLLLWLRVAERRLGGQANTATWDSVVVDGPGDPGTWQGTDQRLLQRQLHGVDEGRDRGRRRSTCSRHRGCRGVGNRDRRG
jgi:hypothetical protein